MTMLVFSSPGVAKGGLELALARKSPGTYFVVFPRASGMAASRFYIKLNASTPRSTIPATSAAGHPVIWLDPDMERLNLGFAEGEVLAALKAADAQVIRATGRTQRMSAKDGGEREAHEVELLVEEDQLAHCCWYCDLLELNDDVRADDRYLPCGGEGYETTYMCPNCAKKSALARGIAGVLRSFSSD